MALVVARCPGGPPRSRCGAGTPGRRGSCRRRCRARTRRDRPGRSSAKQRVADGRHAGREAGRRGPALQDAHLLLEGLHGRVRVAAVDVPGPRDRAPRPATRPRRGSRTPRCRRSGTCVAPSTVASPSPAQTASVAGERSVPHRPAGRLCVRHVATSFEARIGTDRLRSSPASRVVRGTIESSSTYSPGAWSSPPMGPRPSMVGTPRPAVVLPSEAPPVAASPSVKPSSAATVTACSTSHRRRLGPLHGPVARGDLDLADDIRHGRRLGDGGDGRLDGFLVGVAARPAHRPRWTRSRPRCSASSRRGRRRRSRSRPGSAR